MLSKFIIIKSPRLYVPAALTYIILSYSVKKVNALFDGFSEKTGKIFGTSVAEKIHKKMI